VKTAIQLYLTDTKLK